MERLSYKCEDGNIYFIDVDNMVVVPKWYDNINNQLTDEYSIVEKIRNNEEGFFDFSKNIIDVGAYIGEYSALLDFKHSYCFEPNKKTAALLWMNLYLRGKVEESDVFNVCVSDQNGFIDYDGFFCKGDITSFYKPAESEEMKTTECRTLDSFNIKNVGFIKIDVEGFEEKVIRGGLLTIISNDYPPILFECWPLDPYYSDIKEEQRDSLFNLLKTLGYEIFEGWGNEITHLAVHKAHLNK